MPFPGGNGWLSTEYMNIVLFRMAGSRKSTLINTIFKCLALAQPAVINHTRGRESPTSRPVTGGIFTFTK